MPQTLHVMRRSQVTISDLLSSEGGCGLGPALQRMPRLRSLCFGFLELNRPPGSCTWSVSCNHLELPPVLQLLNSLVSLPSAPPPRQAPPGWVPGSHLGRVALAVTHPAAGSEEAWRRAAQGLGAALEAGGCQAMDLTVRSSEARALMTPGVAARLVRLGVWSRAEAMLATVSHLATLPLPALEELSVFMDRRGPQGEGAQAASAPRLLGALTRLAAPRLRSVTIVDSAKQQQQQQQQELVVALAGLCAGRPQPVDAAGKPVPLVVRCALSPSGFEHASLLLREAGLEGRVQLVTRW